MIELYEIEGGHSFFNCNKSKFIVAKDGNFKNPSKYIICLIIEEIKNGKFVDSLYKFDSIKVEAAKMKKYNGKLSKLMLDILNFSIDMKDMNVFLTDKKDEVKIKTILLNMIKKELSLRTILRLVSGTNIKDILMYKTRNIFEKAGIAQCYICKKYVLLPNNKNFEGIDVCCDCIYHVKRCANCHSLTVQNYKKDFLHFCSNSCMKQYKPLIPRFCGDMEDIDNTTYNNVSARTYGIELEVADLKNIKPWHHLINTFKCVGDGSIRSRGDNNTGEFVSCILKGDDGFRKINTLVDWFKSTKIEANSTCGYHLHVGCQDFTGEDLKNITQWSNNNYNLISSIVAPNRVENSYCQKYRYNKCPDKITEVDDVFLFLMENKEYEKNSDEYFKKIDRFKENKKCGPRYRWFNISPFGQQKTIEIRNHHGTVDRLEIIYWIKLWVAIFDGIKNSTLSQRTYTSISELINNLDIKSNKDKVLKFYERKEKLYK